MKRAVLIGELFYKGWHSWNNLGVKINLALRLRVHRQQVRELHSVDRHLRRGLRSCLLSFWEVKALPHKGHNILRHFGHHTIHKVVKASSPLLGWPRIQAFRQDSPGSCLLFWVPSFTLKNAPVWKTNNSHPNLSLKLAMEPDWCGTLN